MPRWARMNRRVIGRIGLILTFLLGGAGLGIHVAHAADCTVGSGYATIQAAVNDASCATIMVPAGTYTENVTINRDVTITGDSAGSTIVDGNNTGAVFTVQAGTVTRASLTIQNGSSAFGGDGILNHGTLRVTNSIVRNNRALSGDAATSTGYIVVAGGDINNTRHAPSDQQHRERQHRLVRWRHRE